MLEPLTAKHGFSHTTTDAVIRPDRFVIDDVSSWCRHVWLPSVLTPLDARVAIPKASPGKSRGSSWSVGVLDLLSCWPTGTGRWVSSTSPAPRLPPPRLPPQGPVGGCPRLPSTSPRDLLSCWPTGTGRWVSSTSPPPRLPPSDVSPPTSRTFTFSGNDHSRAKSRSACRTCVTSTAVGSSRRCRNRSSR
jgi:hypothetical protein